jgi:hypothetical protein
VYTSLAGQKKNKNNKVDKVDKVDFFFLNLSGFTVYLKMRPLLSLRPGSDLMAKGVARNSSVIKIITSALINSTDDYIVADSE